MSTITISRPTAVTEVPGCTATSPGGTLSCINEHCNGRSHVWVHASSARDRKRDRDASSGD